MQLNFNSSNLDKTILPQMPNSLPNGQSVGLQKTDERHFSGIAGSALEAFQQSNTGSATQEDKNVFLDLINTAIKKVNNQQVYSDKISQQMISQPDSVNVHDVMISIQKAQMSLDLTRNVINKATSSYQAIINMR